jgi:hypothetical protein
MLLWGLFPGPICAIFFFAMIAVRMCVFETAICKEVSSCL